MIDCEEVPIKEKISNEGGCDLDVATNQEEHKVQEDFTPERRFSCEVCGDKFKRSLYLKRHLTKHSGVRNYVCDQCNKTFRMKGDLDYHKTYMHATDKTFQCEVCPKSFATSQFLRKHSQVHDKSNFFRFVCEVCEKRFQTPSKLEVHMSKHSGEKNFKCDQCDKGYKSKFYLSLHKIRAHATEKPLQCDVCPNRFATPSLLKQHIRNHHEEKPINCDHCSNSYYTKSQLANHKAAAHDIGGNFSCPFCEKHFVSASKLKLHVVRHTGEKNFQCDQCDDKFKRKANLDVHKLCAHAAEENPYKCDQCSEAYKTAYRLASHKFLVHIDDNKFDCKVCGNRFVTLGNLKKHLVSHSDERKFKCDQCGKMYKYKGDLAKHKKTVHATAEIIENAKGAGIVDEVKVEPISIYDSETKREFLYLNSVVKEEPEQLDNNITDVVLKQEPEDIKEICFM